MPVKALTHQDIQCLMDDLSRTSDTRKRRGIRHSRIFLVATLVCGILSGACHTRAMAEWAANLSNSLKRRLGFRRPPKTRILIAPSEPTLRRPLQSIDVFEVDRVLPTGSNESCPSVDSAESVGSGPLRPGGPGSVEGQRRSEDPHPRRLPPEPGDRWRKKSVDEKTNEIPELRALLAPMAIDGLIVTADALHTQTETARFITEDKKADYVFTVKKTSPPCTKTSNASPGSLPPSADGLDPR